MSICKITVKSLVIPTYLIIDKNLNELYYNSCNINYRLYLIAYFTIVISKCLKVVTYFSIESNSELEEVIIYLIIKYFFLVFDIIIKMDKKTLEEYKTIFIDKLNKNKIEIDNINVYADKTINYLYNNNDLDGFIQKMYEMFIALDIKDNDKITELLTNVSKLNQSKTYDLSKTNEEMYKNLEIKKKN